MNLYNFPDFASCQKTIKSIDRPRPKSFWKEPSSFSQGLTLPPPKDIYIDDFEKVKP